VVEAADFRRFFRLRLAIDFVVGEREERQSPTIAQPVKRMAERNVPLDPRVEVLLAPCGN